ncbi:MAG: ATP-binding protein [Eubacteriaceae bacterium]
MRITFRSKFLLMNLFIIVITMLLLTIIVVQGLMYYNINSVQKRLLQYCDDAVLYIQQELITTQPSGNYNATLITKSLAIAENLARVNQTRVLLYDIEGEMITDSANVEIANDLDLSDEVSTALKLEKGKSVSTYKRTEELSRIYSATPIFVENELIGVVAFVYSLEFMDTIVHQVVILFIGSAIIGILILIVVSTFMTKSLFKPIHQLVESTQRISQGNYTELIKYNIDDEIGELTRNFNKMSLNIEDKISQIEEEKQKLSSIISSINDGVLAVNFNKKILILNDKAKHLLKINENLTSISSLENLVFIQDIFNEILINKTEITKNIDYLDKHLLIYSNIIMYDNNMIGVLLVIRDVTKFLELDKQQRQFISSVSHELRTPLTTIIGYTDLLQRRGVENSDLLDKSLNTINKEGKRLLRLVDDLLNLSKYQNTDFQMIFSHVDINSLIEDVVSQMKLKSQKYNIDIVYNSLVLPIIKGDYDRLKQVFINILDNSIKYSNNNEIIKIVATEDEKYVVISIRDYGQGIPENTLNRIFEPFYRVDENRSRDLGGTGLGMSIVKKIVERHNGQIYIESMQDEGTMVVLKLMKEN